MKVNKLETKARVPYCAAIVRGVAWEHGCRKEGKAKNAYMRHRCPLRLVANYARKTSAPLPRCACMYAAWNVGLVCILPTLATELYRKSTPAYSMFLTYPPSD